MKALFVLYQYCQLTRLQEYLVWAEIPSSAIISVISVEELRSQMQQLEEDTFELEILQKHTSLRHARPIIEIEARSTAPSYLLGMLASFAYIDQ